jgi:hypothetical protein
MCRLARRWRMVMTLCSRRAGNPDLNMLCTGVARFAEIGRGRIDMLIDMVSLLLFRDGLVPPVTGM